MTPPSAGSIRRATPGNAPSPSSATTCCRSPRWRTWPTRGFMPSHERQPSPEPAFRNDTMNPEEKSFLSLRTLPARLNPEQTAWYLGCKVDAVTVLIAAGLLKPLGRPSQTAVKFFSLAELEALRGDTKWLSRTTEAIQSWHRRKNGRPVMTA